jgi:hypothetical protein
VSRPPSRTPSAFTALALRDQGAGIIAAEVGHDRVNTAGPRAGQMQVSDHRDRRPLEPGQQLEQPVWVVTAFPQTSQPTRDRAHARVGGARPAGSPTAAAGGNHYRARTKRHV